MDRHVVWTLVAAAATVALLVPAVAPLDLGVSPPGVAAPVAPLPVPPGATRGLPPTSAASVPSLPPRADAPSPVASAEGGPYATLLARMGHLQDPSQLGGAVADYFRAMNLAAPVGNGAFEENTTIAFTYNIGDVTADGEDDVALDQYCNTWDGGCTPGSNSILNPTNYANNELHPAVCGWPHRLVAVSGADGAEIWSRRLDTPEPLVPPYVDYPNYPTYACALTFVIGSVPLGDGRSGLLTYRWSYVSSVNGPEVVYAFKHHLALVDPADGQEKWTHDETGSLVYQGATQPFLIHADNWLLVPNLEIAPAQGIEIVPRTVQPSLFLQGVGYDAVYQDSTVTVPGTDNTYPILDAYWPNEFASRLDPLTGVVAWRVSTYTPDRSRSVVPETVAAPGPFVLNSFSVHDDGRWYTDSVKGAWFWGAQPCCFDATGDGIPDLVYWTREWSSTPSYNPDGPHFLDVKARLIDGATGSIVWEVTLQKDSPSEHWRCAPGAPFCVEVWPQLLGDATGDAKADFLFHVVYYDADYFHRISVLDGPTGKELWSEESRRNVDALVIGDADGDHGNDFVTYQWYNNEANVLASVGYGAANVTQLSLAVRSGRDGHTVWRAPTFAAPADLAIQFATYRTNGVPDFNNDGIGDVPIDDPVYYPDLTVVHRLSMASGKDGHPFYRINSVGSFGIPALTGDLTGDGVGDVAVVGGDVNDLWVTIYDGVTGKAMWSRRVMSLKTANYLRAEARIRVHPLSVNGTHPDSLLFNVHFQLVTATGFIVVSSNTPQLAAYHVDDGQSRWAIPVFPDADFTTVVPGASPLSQLYDEAYHVPPAQPLSIAGHGPVARAALGAALFVLCGVAAFGLTQWRRFR